MPFGKITFPRISLVKNEARSHWTTPFDGDSNHSVMGQDDKKSPQASVRPRSPIKFNQSPLKVGGLGPPGYSPAGEDSTGHNQVFLLPLRQPILKDAGPDAPVFAALGSPRSKEISF